MSEPCTGCKAERDEPLETLWANTNLGLAAVHVHRHEPCADAARAELAKDSRGPVEFGPPPPLRLPGAREEPA